MVAHPRHQNLYLAIIDSQSLKSSAMVNTLIAMFFLCLQEIKDYAIWVDDINSIVEN
jgi:hypothetical protein